MSARTKARKRALDVLFESDARDVVPSDLLLERIAAAEPPVNPYTAVLVRGVQEHIGRIDALLTSYAVGWTLDRMPAVDRNVLRIGVFEVLYVDDVPDAVAVSEAVGLVRDLSTDESPSFVNGLLAGIIRDKGTLTAEPA
jgi:N utilization substance protein B